MQIKAIEEVTQREEVLQRVECDKCGIPDIDTVGMYDVFGCRLEIEEGTHFPEGRHVEKISMDLCQACTLELRNLLSANGYRLNVER